MIQEAKRGMIEETILVMTMATIAGILNLGLLLRNRMMEQNVLVAYWTTAWSFSVWAKIFTTMGWRWMVNFHWYELCMRWYLAALINDNRW